MQQDKLRVKICRLMLILIALAMLSQAAAAPTGPDNISNNTIEPPSPTSGYLLNASGGTIMNYTFNVTQTNSHWQGLVGNIVGRFALQDAESSALFNWDVTSVTGELFATRNSTVPDWTNIACADSSIILTEETALNITSTRDDSINRTFSSKAHEAFFAGTSNILKDTCYSTALNVNNTRQSTDFQELLLTDGTNIIFTSLLENNAYGFNNQTYDFQMILPGIALEGDQPNTAYYLYVELQ
jgi:hypothetical protein